MFIRKWIVMAAKRKLDFSLSTPLLSQQIDLFEDNNDEIVEDISQSSNITESVSSLPAKMDIKNRIKRLMRVTDKRAPKILPPRLEDLPPHENPFKYEFYTTPDAVVVSNGSY